MNVLAVTRNLGRIYPHYPQSLHYYTYKNMSLSYHPCPAPKSNTPLVILLPWLKANPKHINKYLDIYHAKGYDVLMTQIQVRHFLWPALCNNALDLFLAELSSTQHVQRPLIFHSFSVGSFFLSTLHLRILDEPNRYAEMSDRILGYVSDSITIGSPSEMIEGIIRASFPNAGFGSKVVKGVLSSYFFLTRPWTVSFYERVIDAWYNYPPPSAPMLYYYSYDDPMSNPEAMQKLLSHQKNIGRKIETMYWEKSAHAMHYIQHKEDYTQALNGFLHKVDPTSVKMALSKL